MAVYKKTYRPYSGQLTAAWSRFLVLPRYAFEDMRKRRFLSTFYVATLLSALVYALIIYINQNLNFLKFLPDVPQKGFLDINARFFMNFLGVQSMFAFFIAAFAGPGLISPDLANNGLPLYLSRPFSRVDYVLGKMSVLVILLSVTTWIPGLLLFALQGYLAGGTWAADNMRIVWALLAGAWTWILVLTLLALALSAWVKWKPVAGAMVFGVFFVGAGMGAAVNAVLRTKWGHLMNVGHLVGSVWVTLFEEPMNRGSGAMFFRVLENEAIPVWCCWAMLAAICASCVWLLSRKIRGTEVVS